MQPIKKPPFLFLFVFWGISPQQKIPRELSGREDPAIFLRSHVPMKRFLDGMDQENSKTQGGKGQIRKIQEKQEGKNGGKKKKRFFLYITTYMEVPILTHVFSIGREHTQAIALVQPSLWRTHSYGNLPYNIIW